MDFYICTHRIAIGRWASAPLAVVIPAAVPWEYAMLPRSHLKILFPRSSYKTVQLPAFWRISPNMAMKACPVMFHQAVV